MASYFYRLKIVLHIYKTLNQNHLNVCHCFEVLNYFKHFHSNIFTNRLFCHSAFTHLRETEAQVENGKQTDICKESLDADTFGTLKCSLEKKNEKNMNYNSPRRYRINPKKQQTYVQNTSKDNPDVFGTLANEDIYTRSSQAELLPEDYDDDKSLHIVHEDIERHPMIYFKKLKQLVKDKRLKDALELLEEMKQNKIKMIKPTYTLMIGACGRAGYTKMAFELFKKMREHGLNPSPATLTGLFNACAESPFPKSGLSYARYLQEKIQQKGWIPTPITYHAIIKAFGRCGDIKTAFQVVDEMIKAKVRVTNETFNFLLMSCISDKEAGYTLAILVMRRMKKMRITPDANTYNLFLRAVRDCAIGPPEISSQLLWTWKGSLPSEIADKDVRKHNNIPLLPLQNSPVQMSESPTSIAESKNSSSESSISLPEEANCSSATQIESIELVHTNTSYMIKSENKQHERTHNLLAPRPGGPQVIGLENILYAKDRLALVGGLKGVVELMQSSNINPNLKTFTLLLECIPSTIADEQCLMEIMDLQQVKPDTDFFNLLIKRRNYRKDFRAALDTLKLIQEHGLYPDIVTFGVLALGCWKQFMGMELLKNMKDAGFRPNVEIIGAMVYIAKQKCDGWYLVHLMNVMKDLNICPNPYILEQLELAKQCMTKAKLSLERGEDVKPFFKTKHFEEGCRVFFLTYTQWLNAMKLDLPQHPWDQYKTEKQQEKNALSS